MEVKTRKVCVEPIIFIEYNPKKKRFVGSLEVNTDCAGHEAIRNVLVEGTTAKVKEIFTGNYIGIFPMKKI